MGRGESGGIVSDLSGAFDVGSVQRMGSMAVVAVTSSGLAEYGRRVKVRFGSLSYVGPPAWKQSCQSGRFSAVVVACHPNLMAYNDQNLACFPKNFLGFVEPPFPTF